jgi:F-type H+-transporting ATPase subunit gamma
MSVTYDMEKKIRVFSDIGEIVDAMKAYAGVAIRRTDGIIANVREYERIVLLALGDAASDVADGRFAEPGGAKRLFVAFGSSQGLCGAYNDKIADTICTVIKRGDSLYIIGKKLKASLESRGVRHDAYQDFIAGVSGIEQAWRDCISRLLDLYRSGEYYSLILLFTTVSGKQATISMEKLLPPDICRMPSQGENRGRPFSYLEAGMLFDRLLEEFIGIGIYRGLVESLRSENWFRLRSMEGASENIRRRISELDSLRKYLRQEEITGEILEILGSGGFYG